MSLAPVTANYANQPLLDAYSKPHSDTKSSDSGLLKAEANKSSAVLDTKKTDKPNFLEQLLKKTGIKTEKPSLNQMQSRLADIKKLGTTLRHHPEPSMVKAYVTEVKSFLMDVRDNAYEGHKSPEDLFEKVDVVDKKLDELADDFLASQKPEMQLIDSLGALEGLLIDILV